MANLSGEQVLQADVLLLLPENQECHNIFHYGRVDNVGGSAATGIIIQTIQTEIDALYAALVPHMVTGVSVEYTTWRMGTWTVNGETGFWEYGPELVRKYMNLDGTSTGEMLPHQTALLLTGDTDQARTTSKKYFGGLNENAQAAGRWTPSFLTDVVDVLVQYLLPVVVGTFDLSPVVASSLGAFVPIVSGLINEIVSQQRRRKIGVGV